jgi:hypothetical protein
MNIEILYIQLIMKYVYVLASGIKDVYCEQALVSITSLRMHMPRAHVVLIVDNFTDQSLTGARSKIKELIDELLVVALDENMKQVDRSRYLKTSIRNLIDGDFLYIDTDTVIVADLSPIFKMNCEIGAVLSAHSKLSGHISRKIYHSARKKLKFSIVEDDCYFNGGLLFVRDTEIARAFFKRWNELWHYSVSKNYHLDQLALSQTNYEFKYIIKELSGEWNCQILYGGVNYLENVKIIHFHYSVYKPNHMLIDKYYDIKNHGDISEDTMKIIRNIKTSFYEDTLIIRRPLEDVTNTNLFDFIKGLYNKCRFIFSILDICVTPILKIRRKINEFHF